MLKTIESYWQNLAPEIKNILPQLIGICAIFILSFHSLILPMNGEADAYSHASSAFEKFTVGCKFPLLKNSIWLPGYFKIFCFVQQLFGQTILALRSATLFIHCLSIIPLWKISIWLKERLKVSSWYPWIILIIYLISPLRLVYADKTLSEPIFLTSFLFAVSVWLPTNNQGTSQRLIAILGSIFWLFISQTIRYEAWYLLPFWWWIILFEPKLKKWQKTILFSLTVFYPVVALIYQRLSENHFLEFGNTQIIQELVASGQSIPAEYFRLIPSIWMVFLPVLMAFSMSGSLLWFYGGWLSWKKAWQEKLKLIASGDWNYFLSLWLIPIVLILMLVFQVFTGLFGAIYTRYLLVSYTLALPWIVFGGFQLSKWLKNNWWPDFLPGIVIICAIVLIELIVNFQHQNLLFFSHLLNPQFQDAALISKMVTNKMHLPAPKHQGDQAILNKNSPKVWLFGSKDPIFAYLTGISYLVAQPMDYPFDPNLMKKGDLGILATNFKFDNALLNQVIIESSTANFLLIQKP